MNQTSENITQNDTDDVTVPAEAPATTDDAQAEDAPAESEGSEPDALEPEEETALDTKLYVAQI